MTTRLPDNLDAQYTYHLIIPHPSEPLCLLQIEGIQWSLPRFEPIEPNFGRVQHINRHLWNTYGLHAVTLRCLRSTARQDGHIERYFAIDNLDPYWQPPEGLEWASEYDAQSLPLRSGQTKLVIQEWYDWINSESSLRVPWVRRGWFNKAADTLVDMADRMEMVALTEVEQIRMWARSCTLRLRSNNGDLYLKAVPDSLSYEPVVTRVLALRYAGYIPSVLGVHVDKGWLLMGDFGSQYLTDFVDFDTWERVVRRYALIQRDMVDNAQSLNALGVPNRHLDYIASQVPRIVYNPPEELNPSERRDLKRYAATLRTMLFDIGEYKIPLSLTHGDLRPGNIIVQDNREPLFFDWSDSAISHPFFDLSHLLRALPPGLQSEETQAQLRDTYLSVWTRYEPMPHLLQAYEYAQVLSYLHQALIYQTLVLPNTESSTQWEVRPTLVRLVRQMLQALRESDA